MKDTEITSENVSFRTHRTKNNEIRQSLYDIYIVESYKHYNSEPAPWGDQACCTIFWESM